MRQTCQTCIYSIPNEGAFNRCELEWQWSDDYECCLEVDEYPVVCDDYVENDFGVPV